MSSASASSSSSQVQEEVLVLFHAACIGRTDIIQNAIKLIKKDSLKDNEDFISVISSKREEDGATPLHLASFYNHSDVVRALLNAEADPTVRGLKGDYTDKLPYEVSSERIKKTYELFFFEQIALNNPKMIKKLLLSGIKIDTVDENDDSALHWAVNFNSLECVEELLRLGGDIDRVNKDGDSLLHIAFKSPSYDLIYLLLSEGAKIDTINTNGKLAKDLLPSKIDGELKEKVLGLLINPPAVEKKNRMIFENNKKEVEKEKVESSIESSKVNSPESLENVSLEKFLNEIDENDLLYSSLSSSHIKDSIADPPISSIQLPLFFWPPVKHQSLTYSSLPLSISSNYLCLSTSNVLFISLPNNKSDMSPMLKWSGLARCLSEYGFQITTKKAQPESSNISIIIDPNIISQLVSYKIEVNANKIFIISGDFAGILYGLETFRQLIESHSMIRGEGKEKELFIPYITLTDSPDIINRSILWSFRSYIQWNWNILKETVTSFFLSRINQIYLILDGINDDNKWNIPSKIVYDQSIGNSMSEVNDKKNLLLFEQYCAAHLIEIIPTFFLTSIHTQLPVLVLKDMQHSMISINLFHDLESLRHDIESNKFKDDSNEALDLENQSIDDQTEEQEPRETATSPSSFDLFGIFSLRSQSNTEELVEKTPKESTKKITKTEENTDNILSDEIIIEAYKTYCNKLFQNISQCDFTTIQLACSPWVLEHINPQVLAQSLGLNLNFISNSQFLPTSLMPKSILGASSYIENMERYITKIYDGVSYKNSTENIPVIQSKNMSCLPLYNELDFNLPSIILKFYINIFGSYSWNIKGTKDLLDSTSSELASNPASFSNSPLFLTMRNFLFPEWKQLSNNVNKKSGFDPIFAIEEVIKLFMTSNRPKPNNENVFENILDVERKLTVLFNSNNNQYSSNSFFLPSRSSLSYCSKLYKKLLLDCNWNIRERSVNLNNYSILLHEDSSSSNSTPVTSPRSFMEYMGFFSTASSFNPSNSFQAALILYELDEFFSYIHSLNTLSKLSLQSFNSYLRKEQEKRLIKLGDKDQKDIINQEILVDGLTFPSLCGYLTTGSRSDSANSLLESVSFLISLYKYKFSPSLLKLFMNSHNLVNIKNELAESQEDFIFDNPNINKIVLKKYIDLLEKKSISQQFITQKLPLVPMSSVFRFICQELDVPRSLYEYIETIFR